MEVMAGNCLNFVKVTLALLVVLVKNCRLFKFCNIINIIASGIVSKMVMTRKVEED